MARAFDLVDWKLAEADFFLGQVSECGTNFFAVRCYVSAFVASARSVTFAMQSCLGEIDGFREWYSLRQQELRADPLARFFHEFRRVNQHIGENLVTGGTHDRDGRCRYRFTATEDIQHIPKPDVQTACEAYFVKIVTLVYDCYIAFGPLIDPKQHYTAEHFAAIGRTIEDAEEELFGVRGWTEVNGYPEGYRWQALRDSQPGCGVNQLFEEYLGKTAPEPDRLPELPPADDDGWSRLKNWSRVHIPEELKQTGDPDEDIRLYIESLRKARGT